MTEGSDKGPVVLIVRDGWGLNPKAEGNAVLAANTPNCDKYLKEYPWTVLEASGEAVGLPAGYQGSSEVGHLNMGAGRVVVQELKRLNDALESGALLKEPQFLKVIEAAKQEGSALHLMGLVQDEGVHAHMDHLCTLLAKAKEMGVRRCYVHFFGDGRDTPQRSGLLYLEMLQEKFDEIGLGEVGTVMGRYYSMDRSENWKLTSIAYNAIVDAKADRRAKTAEEAIRRSYDEDKTPDGFAMSDEYIPPTIVGDYPGVQDGDGVIHTNYRQDRAIQLTKAFVEDDYPGERSRRPRIEYAGLTRYYDQFEHYLIGAIDTGGGMENLLGKVLSDRGIRQLRVAETQKFRHVTSFFNGKRTAPYPLEDQVEVPSEWDPASFASHPEMNAHNVLNEAVKRLDKCQYGFVAVNWANCDMVGHTGEFDAAVKAVEVVDDCVGQLVRKAVTIGARVLITADHGNAEQMVEYDRTDPETGKPAVKTAHTTNDVECVYLGADAKDVKLVERGKLCDIAPTVLRLLGIPQPKEMTARSLILG